MQLLFFPLPIYGLSSCRMPYKGLINHSAATGCVETQSNNSFQCFQLHSMSLLHLLYFLSIGTLIVYLFVDECCVSHMSHVIAH